MLTVYRTESPGLHLLGFVTLAVCFGVLCWGHWATRPEDRRDLWTAILISSIGGVIVASLGLVVLKQYGWALFTGLPFGCGLLSTALYTRRGAKTFLQIVGVTSLTLAFLGFCILTLALDGAICVLMALPLAWPLAILGALVGDFLASRYRRTRDLKKLLPVLIVCAALPLLVGFESRCDLAIPSSTVVTEIDIAAPAEVVWRFVPVVPPIRSAPSFLFQLGIACPLRSNMVGQGFGASRQCVLSTGTMQEKITKWEEGRCLRFQVLSTPPPMDEVTVYLQLHPAHLDHFYECEWGQFELVSLGKQKTRLIGTSHYHNRIWPGEYWLLISDYIVHQVHRRVLSEIKADAEASMAETR